MANWVTVCGGCGEPDGARGRLSIGIAFLSGSNDRGWMAVVCSTMSKELVVSRSGQTQKRGKEDLWWSDLVVRHLVLPCMNRFRRGLLWLQ